MPRPRLLLTRHLPASAEARAARDYDARLNTADEPWARDGAEIARRAVGCDGVLAAAGDRLDAACIAALPASVKIVATFSVGTDHIAFDAARAKNIVVTNTPEVLSFATAECAFTLLLMAARRAGEGERLVRGGGWEGWAPTQLLGVTLEGKALGIAGFGRIGREVARFARGFGMAIHYHDIRQAPPELEQGATFHADAREFLGAIDMLSMHMPGGAETRHWLDAGRIGWLKPGAIVVNTGRGPTVHDASLIAALRSGHVRAAGLDVYDGEPRVDPGYRTLENVALLPHLGSATEETRHAMAERCFANLDAVLLRGERAPDALT